MKNKGVYATIRVDEEVHPKDAEEGGKEMAEKQTLIADMIDSTDLEAKYDSQAKRLVSMTVILAWILKTCVDEFKQIAPRRKKKCSVMSLG